MTYNVIIQARAKQDIRQAFEYIKRENPEAASQWYQQIKADIQSLAHMPTRCSLAPESTKLEIDLRQLLFGKRNGQYRIVFRIIDEEAHILTIRHGARTLLNVDEIAE